MTDAKQPPAPVTILSDAPASEPEAPEFAAYADTLAGVVANKENTTPMALGIYGTWGSGKTTLMKQIKARLEGGGKAQNPSYRQCHTVWFQAWKHTEEEEILAAFIEAIFKSMAAHGFFTLARARVDAITRRIDQSKMFTSISKLVNGMDVSEFFAELPHKEQLGRFDTFQKFIDDLLWTFLTWRFKIGGQEKPDDRKCAMVIFVDDLDRCAPGQIVKMLETIKLFMDRSGCIFVLGAAHETLVEALTGRYGRSDALRFIEKVVPGGFHVPPMPAESFGTIIDHLAGDRQGLRDALTEHLSLIAPALDHNPRRLKRFINHLNLLRGLLGRGDGSPDFASVLAWTIIEHAFEALAADIRHHPATLFDLQQQITRLSQLQVPESETPDQDQGLPLWQLSEHQLDKHEVPEALHCHIRQPGLADVVSRCDLTPGQLGRLCTLSGALGPGDGPGTHRPSRP